MAKWEYAPAPESTEIVDIKDTYGLFIGGQFVEPASGEYFKTINPATEEVLAAIPVADDAGHRSCRWGCARSVQEVVIAARKSSAPSTSSVSPG